jgi:hypothetical protein
MGGAKQVGFCGGALDVVRFFGLNAQQARHLRKYGKCPL